MYYSKITTRMTKKKSPKEGGEVVVLSPGSRIVEVRGKLFYSEGDQSWNLIRLRREVLHEFPQLKEKSSTFGYTMLIPKTKGEIEEALTKFEKTAVPILLFFNKMQNNI